MWLLATSYLVAQCRELRALALRLRACGSELRRHLPEALDEDLAVCTALHGRHLRLLHHRLDLVRVRVRVGVRVRFRVRVGVKVRARCLDLGTRL